MASVDLKDLIQQAENDPHAAEVLTDYFEEQGFKKPTLGRPYIVHTRWGRRLMFDHGIFIDHTSEIGPSDLVYSVYRSGQPSFLLGQTKTLAAAKKIANRAIQLDPLAWKEAAQRKKYTKRRLY